MFSVSKTSIVSTLTSSEQDLTGCGYIMLRSVKLFILFQDFGCFHQPRCCFRIPRLAKVLLHVLYSRILVFSPAKVLYVKVNIDGQWLGDAYLVEKSLYALKWNPGKYLSGLHSITVSVQVFNTLFKNAFLFMQFSELLVMI